VKTRKQNILTVILYLLVGIFLLTPAKVRAADDDDGVRLISESTSASLSLEENGSTWSCTLEWKAMKGCSYYEVYRDSELVAAISDGTCRWTDTGLKYGKTYRYDIYEGILSDGTFQKKYWSLKVVKVKVPGITPEYDSRTGVYSYCSITANSFDIQFEGTGGDVEPDYLVVRRVSSATGKVTKKKVAWSDFEAAGYKYTDTNLKSKSKYEYSFWTSLTVNGTEKKSEVYRISIYTYKSYGNTVDFEVQSSSDAETMVLKLTNTKGNAPLLINKKDTLFDLHTYGTQSNKNNLVIKAFSYDGKNWFIAKNNLYIELAAKESIYLKLKSSDGSKFSYSSSENELEMKVRYMQDPLGGKNNGFLDMTYHGKLTKKKQKTLRINSYSN
jgi:hypothetical protein